MKNSFKILRFTSLDSTNATAKAMLQQGLVSEATVIVAATQTAGRGQMQTKWHDEMGQNLLCTVIIPKLNLPAAQFFSLNMAVCLALADTLQDFGSVAVKWPNDMLFQEKKIAGVLIENTLVGENIAHSCIGMGLNVNQENWPPEIIATSLKQALHRDFDIEIILQKVLKTLQLRLSMLGESQLKTDYENLLFGKNQWRRYEDDKGIFEARVVGVAEDGVLMLERATNNLIQRYRFKEVRWLDL